MGRRSEKLHAQRQVRMQLRSRTRRTRARVDGEGSLFAGEGHCVL